MEIKLEDFKNLEMPLRLDEEVIEKIKGYILDIKSEIENAEKKLSLMSIDSVEIINEEFPNYTREILLVTANIYLGNLSNIRCKLKLYNKEN